MDHSATNHALEVGSVIPFWINGEEIKSTSTFEVVSPLGHKKLYSCCYADDDHVQAAIGAAQKALPMWASTNPKQHRSLFRKTVYLESFPTGPVNIQISADTRYCFFLNGKRASFGPCQSYPTRWYYETTDVLPFLQIEKNVFAAKVLRFSPLHAGNSSMMRGPSPGLFVHGRLAVSPYSNPSPCQAKHYARVLTYTLIRHGSPSLMHQFS